MRVLLDHALPNKIDYVKLLIDAGIISFYFSMEGKSVHWFGRIEKKSRENMSFTDSEYVKYRARHPVAQVIGVRGEEVVVKTRDGVREHWLKPRWILRRRIRSRS